MPKEISIGAIIFHKNKETQYLLLKYTNYWGFVKGNVEKDETELQTAKREIKEETGITDCIFLKGFKEKISYFYKLKDKPIYKEVIFYLAQTKTKEVKLSFEHEDFKWLPYEEALKLIAFKNSKDSFKKAHKFLMQTKSQKDLSKWTSKP